MSEWRLVVPIVDPAMCDAMLGTLDPQLHASVIVIDNCMRTYRRPSVTVLRKRHNLGVAGSWNLGVHTARQAGAEWVMLASSSTRFGERAGGDIDELCDLAREYGQYALFAHPTYWHTAILSIEVFDFIGAADERFYPAYYEECDIERRMLLAGLQLLDDGQIPEAVLDATTVRDGHGVDVLRESFPRLVTINYDALQDYWYSKWGCHVNDRRNLDVGYRHPFNDERNSIKFWPRFRSIPELRQAYGIVGR